MLSFGKGFLWSGPPGHVSASVARFVALSRASVTPSHCDVPRKHVVGDAGWNDNVTVHGSVPILQKLRHGEADPGDTTRISFCIESRIS